MSKTVDITVKGRQHTLHLEQEKYNGWPAYYITDKGLSTLFDGQVPDDLILFETDAGVQCSPRVITLEGREITSEIWKAIKTQDPDPSSETQDAGTSSPQPFGPGLG